MLVKVLGNTKKEVKKLLQMYVAFSVKNNVLLQFFSPFESIVVGSSVF